MTESFPAYVPGDEQDARPLLNGERVGTKKANKPFLVHARHKTNQEKKLKAKEAEESQYSTGAPRPDSFFLDLLYLGLMGLVLAIAVSRMTSDSWLFGLQIPQSNYLSTRFTKQPFASANTVNEQVIIPGKTDNVFTPAQLARYNGEDPNLPVYLALDGEVWDVSSKRRTYGPGGSYARFAGIDAARAYATGCFRSLTHDLRGLEEGALSSLQGWKDFYRNPDKGYTRVGTVKHPPIDPDSPIPDDCKAQTPPEPAT